MEKPNEYMCNDVCLGIDVNYYYPFGKRIPVTGPVAFGARMYDPTIARWTAADPLSEKYYSISPYAYCMGNPINLIDCLGKKVIPYGSAELEMIRNTLPEEARKYVQLDKNGIIDKELLAQYTGKSLNIKNLLGLVNSGKVVKVLMRDMFSFKGQNGQLGTAHMSYFPFDEAFPEDKDLGFAFVSLTLNCIINP